MYETHEVSFTYQHIWELLTSIYLTQSACKLNDATITGIINTVTITGIHSSFLSSDMVKFNYLYAVNPETDLFLLLSTKTSES